MKGIINKGDAEPKSNDLLIDFFRRYFPLSKEEQAEISARFTERRIKRHGLILQQGDVCKYFTFVVSGCFKMFAADSKGKEHNIKFAAENSWITDLTSFYAEKPSEVYIEAVEPSTILQIKHADLLDLYIKYHKFDRNFRIIVEQDYIELQTRILKSISATTEERYLSFLEQYPDLSNRLPGTQIASYLGITPEFLSKIKKRMTAKQKS